MLTISDYLTKPKKELTLLNAWVNLNGAGEHPLQAVLGHSTVAVTEKHYAEFSSESAAQVTLRVIEGGRAARRQEQERKAG